MIVTFVCGVVVDLLFAVEVGAIMSALLFLRRMTNVAQIRRWTERCDLGDTPATAEQSGYKDIPRDTLVYEFDGPLFFATVDSLIGKLDIREDTDVIILRMRGVSTIDFTAVRALENLWEICKANRIQLIFSHVAEQPYRVLEKAQYVDKIGADNFCKNIDAALERALLFIK